MICPHCQQEHSDSAAFCPNTGKAIKSGEKKIKSNYFKFLPGGILTLLVLAIVGIGGLIFARNDDLNLSFLDGKGSNKENQLLGENSSAQLKPSYNGVFLVKEDSLVEAFEHEGIPDYVSPDEFPNSEDSQPLFIVWLPEIQLQYFVLYNLDNGKDFDYNIASRDDGLLEIQVINSLPAGAYCFYQGNPLASPVDIMHWCFSVGDMILGQSVDNNNSKNTPTATLLEVPTESSTTSNIFDIPAEDNSTKKINPKIISPEGIIDEDSVSQVIEPIIRNYINAPARYLIRSYESEVVIDHKVFSFFSEGFCSNQQKIQSITVFIHTYDQVNAAQSKIDEIPSLYEGVNFINVEEIGDQGLYVNLGANDPSRCKGSHWASLWARRGSVLFSFQAVFSNDYDIYPTLFDIAKLIDNLLLME